MTGKGKVAMTGRKKLAMTRKRERLFVIKKNVTKKSLRFSKGLISNHKNFLKIFVKNSKNFFIFALRKLSIVCW